jgi:hypothetical protein
MVLMFEGMAKEYKSLADEVVDGPLVGRWAILNGCHPYMDGHPDMQADGYCTPYLN